jgi:DNA-binding transcriptional regulator YdaS (Cro superfamily)
MNPMDLLRIEFRTLEALAEKLGIPANTVYQWNKTNIPTKWIKDIEELSELRLTREQLRPDLFKKD